MEDSAHAPARRIAIWGPPGCGKTTFIAALSIALIRQPGDWMVAGRDRASAHALVAMQASKAFTFSGASGQGLPFRNHMNALINVSCVMSTTSSPTTPFFRNMATT